MKIISFAYTTPALLARQKTVTRREWKHSYATSFGQHDRLLAYDRSPRSGGRQVGIIQLTERPYLEHISKMPDDDYYAEGFDYLDKADKAGYFLQNGKYHNIREYFDIQRRYADVTLWVVRFEILELEHEKQQSLFGDQA